jgi:hypothetical protein
MDTCPWKNIFGKPRTGVHAWRIGDIAVVDTALTVVLAYALQKMFFKQTHFLIVLFVTFVVGEIMHWFFCVDTKVIHEIKSRLSTGNSNH